MVLKAKKTRRDHDLKEQAIEEATKEETTRLNAEIPSLHNKVKMRAIQEGKRSSINNNVSNAISQHQMSKVSNE